MRSDVKLRREALLSADTDLVSVLALSRNCLCEDKRDKFYGILGLTTDVDEFDVPVDYSLSLFWVYVSVLQARSHQWGTDDEVLTNYSADQIMTLSRALQKPLLGPDFGMSGFEEMRCGRAEMLETTKADLKYLNIQGGNLGKVIGHTATLKHIPDLSLEQLVGGVNSFLPILKEKVNLSLTSTNPDLSDSWANFCFDLSIGCEVTCDVNAKEREAGLTVFVTDFGNVGVAPNVIMPGDKFWDYGSKCSAMAIVRGEEGSYQLISRACLAKDCIKSGDSAKLFSGTASGPARHRDRKRMTVKLNLAELQRFTSPLRGTRDVEE
ncbi:hypothetical protein ONS95_013371 [Cadophora gregata]|uniref:uncharacterized protein n=1 Tax=Cadophora gregata TaxID=51156 RepID=UPI0026DDCB33|nr:uncharacterized protein ONS95_013371 [Cadophora gregata]KAK0116350.1 hypothetical protein ONS95_013371 [Cadophora gregata]